MESMDLPIICVSAFAAVFLLLSVLAGVMRIIIILFPEKTHSADADAAVIAAAASVVSSLYPGSSITRIEELK